MLGFLRGRSLFACVAAVLLVSLAAGTALDSLTSRRQSQTERAAALAQGGHLDAAERAYLDLVVAHPAEVPLLIAFLDVHDRLQRLVSIRLSARPADPRSPMHGLGYALDESRVDSVLSSSALTGDARLLVEWWRLVLADAGDGVDRAKVVAAAQARPPAPWADHLLGREADRGGRDAEAAESFAREASSFADRRDDAIAACHIWMEADDFDRLGAALANPSFARQVPAVVRMETAIHLRDWGAVTRWYVAAQYEKANLGVVLLAAASGLVWFAICAVVGRMGDRPKVRIPLFAVAFLLGVASTYLTIAAGIAEEDVLHFTEKGQPAADAIYYVFGVGLREEISKALFVLPLFPIIKRFGSRRDALACGGLVGLGFAAEENIGYFHLGLSTALSRFLTANFLHVSTTGLVAVAIDDAVRGDRTTSGAVDAWTRTLPFVVVIHGVYDFFLSSQSFGGASFVSMLTFALLARHFVNVLRQLPGREGPLLPVFVVGLAVVAGATFVYAAMLVGVAHAAAAIAMGALGLAIVAIVFGRELGSVG